MQDYLDACCFDLVAVTKMAAEDARLHGPKKLAEPRGPV